MVQTVPKLNLGRYEFQKMGRIGSTEMYLIWDKFGITKMCSGLIDITGSNKMNDVKEFFRHKELQNYENGRASYKNES